jgi:hypothetical protein
VLEAPIIGLIASVVTEVWSTLEKNRGLVSADPGQYVAAALFVVGIPLFALGTQVKGPRTSAGRLTAGIESLLTIVWVIILSLALFAWLVIIAPAQYFVFLVCAAPSRRFIAATSRPIVSDLAGRVEVRELPILAEMPEGWWDSGLHDKPVALANLCASLLFFAISLVRG